MNVIKKKLQPLLRILTQWRNRMAMFLTFPHVWTCIVIFLLATFSLLTSLHLVTKGCTYWSSMFANLFAGLVTGLVICLIGSMKHISIIKMQEKRTWLQHLASMISEYRELHYKLLKLNFEKFDDSEDLFSSIYDVGSHANWINEEIIQSSYSKTLSFNPEKYCKKHFGYDAMALSKEFQDLRNNLCLIDIVYPSSKMIIQYFESVDDNIWTLNSGIRTAISNLDIRLSAIQKSII